jgi:lipopolysaccharide transport system ATP-binding protein
MLEIGTGFHPDLTGRENMLLNGIILGMSRREVREKYDAIVAFAEVERFIDTPVKHYSTGMYMRLAFAVAAHFEPEILLIDEVLAVGDVAFQRKCLGRMRDVARAGRTVLFVSHNMTAVAALCGRVLLLEHGRLIFAGAVAAGVRRYLAEDVRARMSWEGDAGDDEIRLRRTWVRVADGVANALETHAPIHVGLAVSVLKPVSGLIVGLHVWSQRGYELAFSEANDTATTVPEVVASGEYEYELTIPADTLAAGRYSLHFNVGVHNVKRIDAEAGVLDVEVANTAGLGRHYVMGQGLEDILRPAWQWRCVDKRAT